MTGEQSRLTNVSARVCWDGDQADQGTVTESDWSGVRIVWDNGLANSICHNDMATVPMPAYQRFRLDNRQDLQDRRKPTIELDEEPAIVVRKPGPPPHPLTLRRKTIS